MRTTIINKKSDIHSVWYLIDAKDVSLGRLATKVASLLKGKNRRNYSPDTFFGDHVIIINSGEVKLTGNKETQKRYYWHTGWMGGIKDLNYTELVKKHPEAPIKKAVKGMLPKNRIGRKMLLNLKVYSDDKHPHTAQKPIKVDM